MDEVNKLWAVPSPLLALHAVVASFSITPNPPKRPRAVKGFLCVKALYSRQRCFTEHSHTEELPSLACILEIAVLAQSDPLKQNMYLNTAFL